VKLLKKYKWIILGFFILFLIALVWVGKDLFAPQDGALYGNRLEGIEDVPIGDDVRKNISDYLLSTAGVKKVNINVHGKILSIVILVDETMTVDKAKEISNEAIKKCSTEQMRFYDISILINYDTESKKTDFPLLGYKNKNNDSIEW
jgi:hypothetical protein